MTFTVAIQDIDEHGIIDNETLRDGEFDTAEEAGAFLAGVLKAATPGEAYDVTVEVHERVTGS